MVTRFRYQRDERAAWLDLETERDWSEVMDYTRNKFHGQLPADDPKFKEAMRLQAKALAK